MRCAYPPTGRDYEALFLAERLFCSAGPLFSPSRKVGKKRRLNLRFKDPFRRTAASFTHRSSWTAGDRAEGARQRFGDFAAEGKVTRSAERNLPRGAKPPFSRTYPHKSAPFAKNVEKGG